MLDPNKELDQWGPVDAVILQPSFWYAPMSMDMPKRYRIYWPEIVGIFENNKRGTFYWEKESMEMRGTEAIEKWILPDDKKEKIWSDYEKIVQRHKEVKKAIEEIKESTTKSILGDLAKDVYNLIYNLWAVTLVCEVANFATPKYLRDRLEGRVEASKIDHLLEALLRPEELSFHQQSEKEMLEIIDKKEGNVKVEHFTEYARRWHWVENSYYENKELDAPYFFEIAKVLKLDEVRSRLEQINNYLFNTREEKNRAIYDYELQDLAELADKLPFSIWWQDHRKAELWQMHTLIDKISRALIVHYPVVWDDLMCYRAEEWVEWAKYGKLLDGKEISSRKKLFVADVNGDKYEYHIKEPAEKIRKLLTQTLENREGELKGVVVSKGEGNIKGKIKVILSPRGAEIEDGDILVAPMTTPEYIMLMRKASAIITDVGGLMSHAAVISRELGKPCIVNTKIATQVLRDNDIVEIDTKRGVVKKL